MQAEMENKNPDVKSMLEALVGNLVVWTAEGDLLLEDQKNSSHSRTRTWAVASPIDSFLSKINEATAYVFSNSMSCLGMHDQSKGRQQTF